MKIIDKLSIHRYYQFNPYRMSDSITSYPQTTFNLIQDGLGIIVDYKQTPGNHEGVVDSLNAIHAQRLRERLYASFFFGNCNEARRGEQSAIELWVMQEGLEITQEQRAMSLMVSELERSAEFTRLTSEDEIMHLLVNGENEIILSELKRISNASFNTDSRFLEELKYDFLDKLAKLTALKNNSSPEHKKPIEIQIRALSAECQLALYGGKNLPENAQRRLLDRIKASKVLTREKLDPKSGQIFLNALIKDLNLHIDYKDFDEFWSIMINGPFGYLKGVLKGAAMIAGSLLRDKITK